VEYVTDHPHARAHRDVTVDRPQVEQEVDLRRCAAEAAQQRPKRLRQILGVLVHVLDVEPDSDPVPTLHVEPGVAMPGSASLSRTTGVESIPARAAAAMA